MLCRDVMKVPVVTCKESDSIHFCADLMRQWKVGFLPVVDKTKRAVGVLTDRDIVVRAVAHDLPSSTPASTVMTKTLVTCRVGDALWIAEERMANERKSRIAVVDEAGRCVGVISLSDVGQAETTARAGEVLQDVTQREASPPSGARV